MPTRRRIVRRRKGRGFGDFLKNTLTGVGSGLGSGVHNLLGSLFGGRRRKSYRKKRTGGAKRRTRRVRGRGPNDSLLTRLNKVAKDTGIISSALNEFGNPWGLGTAAGTLGYGRRRRTRRRGGMAHSIMGRVGGSNLNF